MAGGTPLPSEGRLINTALEVDPNGNVNDVFVIGYLGTAGTGRAALICVNLAALLAARGVTAGARNADMDDVDRSVMSTAQSRAVAEPGTTETPEMRVSVQELFDELHEYKAAHFRYRCETVDGAILGRCVAQTQPYVHVTADKTFSVTSKVVGKKTYYILDTGISIDDAAIETVQITVNAAIPTPASIQILEASNTVGIILTDANADVNVSCMLPLVDGAVALK